MGSFPGLFNIIIVNQRVYDQQRDHSNKQYKFTCCCCPSAPITYPHVNYQPKAYYYYYYDHIYPFVCMSVECVWGDVNHIVACLTFYSHP